MTTGQVLNGSDSEYSNPAYDALYVQQAAAVDPAKRKQIVDQMQQILYRDAPYVILWYNVNVQAYRTDTWTGYVSVPPGSAPGAALRNMLRTTYVDLKPKAAATAASGGSSTTTMVAVVVAAIVVIVIVAVIVVRRRSRTVETE